MASTYIDSSLLSVFMTSTGYVALCSNQLKLAEEAALFGNGGTHPPRLLTDLIQQMLADLESVSADEDNLDLTQLELTLEQSLEVVRAAIRN